MLKKIAVVVDTRESVPACGITRDRNGDYRYDGPVGSSQNPNFGVTIADVFEAEGGEEYFYPNSHPQKKVILEAGTILYQPRGGMNFHTAFILEHANAYVGLVHEVGGLREGFVDALQAGKLIVNPL